MLKKISHKIDYLLIGIILLAFLLRFIGIKHGFPFITHPDESAIIRSAMGIKFNPNPGHFDWPHLHFYLNYGVYFLFIKFRGLLQILNLRSSLEPAIPLFWRDPLVFYYISRMVSVFMGTLTVWPIYLSGKSLFNRRAGLFAALAFAIIPFHVWRSHYALVDVPTVFWLSWSLYFSTLIIKSPYIKNYILAGFFVGLAASTKYNGGLAAIMVLLAHLLRIYKYEDEKLLSLSGIKLLVVSGLFAALGFFIGTPYSIIDNATFMRSDSSNGALWQFKNVGKVGFSIQVKKFVNNLTYKLSDDFGYTFLSVYIFTFFYSVYKLIKDGKQAVSRDGKVWFLLIMAFIILWYTSGFEKTRSHYYMITYPFIALIVGYFTDLLLSSKAKKYVLYVLVVVVFIAPLLLSFLNVAKFVRGDTRNVLYDWMQENVVQDDFLIYESNSLMPVLEKFSGNDRKRSVEPEELAGRSGYVIIADEGPVRVLQNKHYIWAQGLENVNRVFEVDPKLMKGTYILVLSFSNEE